MADTTTPAIPAPTPLKIVRNGLSKELVPMQFGKKSKNAGAWFQAPVMSPATFPDDATWFGQDFIVRTVNKVSRLICADIYIGNVNEETGVLNAENYAIELADFTSGIAKLADLEEDKEELEVALSTIVNDPDFAMPDEGETVSEKTASLVAEAKRLGKLIKPIRVQIAEIEAKYQARAAKRKAAKEAAELAAAKAKLAGAGQPA